MNETEHKETSPELSQETHSEVEPVQEPVISGTLFLTMVFLMMLFGFWILFYLTMLDR